MPNEKKKQQFSTFCSLHHTTSTEVDLIIEPNLQLWSAIGSSDNNTLAQQNPWPKCTTTMTCVHTPTYMHIHHILDRDNRNHVVVNLSSKTTSVVKRSLVKCLPGSLHSLSNTWKQKQTQKKFYKERGRVVPNETQRRSKNCQPKMRENIC